jgi:radical SAM protein with 4Fe4S-binding SPASM domain
VYPAGFLPIKAGTVRTQNIVDLYRNSQVFTELRDVTLFKGKCGQCEYSHACGGSRARAFAYTGDPLESDPLCPYEPVRGQTKEVALTG